jgi:hypothetical protein
VLVITPEQPGFKKEGLFMTRQSIAACALSLAVVLLGRPVTLGAEEKGHHDSTETFVVDVAIDAHTLALNNDPTAAGVPHRGTTFIVNGKIYRGGTIPSGVTSFDPSTAPDSIGTWICRGVFLADFADIFVNGTAKDAFDTTQMFLFPDDTNALFTEGFEGNVGVSTHRTVTGGTGRFRRMVGTVKQETIGVNRNGAADGLFDLRFTITVETED